MKKSVGREYQHLEDLLIEKGSSGAIEALSELEDAALHPEKIDFKWDGCSSIFWGRKSGSFVFAPKNQWDQQKLVNEAELINEILNSGKLKNGQDYELFCQQRAELADKFLKIRKLLEAATPSHFEGFLNGDVLFHEPQVLNQLGEYSFTPNKVTYHITEGSFAGRAALAQTFIVVHGYIPKYGQEVTGAIKPIDNATIDQFNQTTESIIMNTQHPARKINIDSNKVQQYGEFINMNSAAIDYIVNFTAPKFTTIRQVLYSFSIARGKSYNKLDFNDWIQTKKISDAQKTILLALSQQVEWGIFWSAYEQLVNLKHLFLQRLEEANNTGTYKQMGIRPSINDACVGEGFIKESNSGNLLKFVNPEFRSAELNFRFRQNYV